MARILKHLRQSVQALAATDKDETPELLFMDFRDWFFVSREEALTDDQDSALIALNQALEQLSITHSDVWSSLDLLQHPDWKQVQEQARNTLLVFGWPLAGGSSNDNEA